MGTYKSMNGSFTTLPFYTLRSASPSAVVSYLVALVVVVFMGLSEARAEQEPHTVPQPPSNAVAQFSAAQRLSNEGEFEAALQQCDKAIKSYPDYAAAHALRGWLLGMDGKYYEAAHEERIAIRLNPGDPGPYITLGLALASVGDYDGAIQANQKAIKLDPKRVRAYVNLGATLGRKGDYAQAIDVYAKVVQMQPDSVAARLGLGAALGRVGDLKGQISQFKIAVALAPQSDSAHGKLGWALYRTGDWQGSLREGSMANWIRLQRSGPEYLQNVLSLWGLVFIIFGIIFAEIAFGARFKPHGEERVVTSFFLVFHKDKPGRLVITDKRVVFVPEAFSRWFGAQPAELAREGLSVNKNSERKNAVDLLSVESTLSLTAPPFVLKQVLDKLEAAQPQP